MFNATFNNMLVTMYIMAISFIGGENRSTRRKPRVPIKCETKYKRNETKRNEINENETKRNETKRNQRNGNEMKRNQRKQNEIN